MVHHWRCSLVVGGIGVINTSLREFASVRVYRIIRTKLDTRLSLFHNSSAQSGGTPHGIRPTDCCGEIKLVLSRVGVLFKHPVPILGKLVNQVFFCNIMQYYKLWVWYITRIITLKIPKYSISRPVSKNRFFLMLKYKTKWSCNFTEDWANISISWSSVVIIKRLPCTLVNMYWYLPGLPWTRGCLLLNKTSVLNCMCIPLCPHPA